MAAHSNQQRDGKGMGIKAHDFRVAYLCSECHTRVDSGKDDAEVRRGLWEAAHRATVAYWFLNGILK